MSSVTRSYFTGRPAEQWTNATQPGDPSPAGYTAWDIGGAVTVQRALTPAEVTQLAAADAAPVADLSGQRAATISGNAEAALAVNAAFLANGSPSSVEVVAQVRVLTRECSGLIRLLLGRLDSSGGT